MSVPPYRVRKSRGILLFPVLANRFLAGVDFLCLCVLTTMLFDSRSLVRRRPPIAPDRGWLRRAGRKWRTLRTRLPCPPPGSWRSMPCVQWSGR